jgi:hypothetical protein
MNSREAISHNDYTNNLENLKKLWLFSNYILDKNLEDSFVSYLKQIREDVIFEDLTSTTASLIHEYEITENDIMQHLNQMIPS